MDIFLPLFLFLLLFLLLHFPRSSSRRLSSSSFPVSVLPPSPSTDRVPLSFPPSSYSCRHYFRQWPARLVQLMATFLSTHEWIRFSTAIHPSLTETIHRHLTSYVPHSLDFSLNDSHKPLQYLLRHCEHWREVRSLTVSFYHHSCHREYLSRLLTKDERVVLPRLFSFFHSLRSLTISSGVMPPMEVCALPPLLHCLDVSCMPPSDWIGLESCTQLRSLYIRRSEHEPMVLQWIPVSVTLLHISLKESKKNGDEKETECLLLHLSNLVTLHFWGKRRPSVWLPMLARCLPQLVRLDLPHMKIALPPYTDEIDFQHLRTFSGSGLPRQRIYPWMQRVSSLSLSKNALLHSPHVAHSIDCSTIERTVAWQRLYLLRIRVDLTHLTRRCPSLGTTLRSLSLCGHTGDTHGLSSLSVLEELELDLSLYTRVSPLQVLKPLTRLSHLERVCLYVPSEDKTTEILYHIPTCLPNVKRLCLIRDAWCVDFACLSGLYTHSTLSYLSIVGKCDTNFWNSLRGTYENTTRPLLVAEKIATRLPRLSHVCISFSSKDTRTYLCPPTGTVHCFGPSPPPPHDDVTSRSFLESCFPTV